MKKVTLTIVSVMLGALIASGAQATVPELVPVQGVLTDDLGEFVDGATSMTFAIYDASDASSAVWTETQSVDVDEGFFTAYLGSTTALVVGDLLTPSELWLGVTVESDDEMDRVQLAAVPFAFEAQRCQQVGNLTESDIFSSETDLTTLLDDNYAPTAHNHDSDYAPISHNHDSDYAPISHNHDSDYAPISHSHAWSDLTGVPAGFADGVDNDTTYSAGTGLDISGTTFSVDPDYAIRNQSTSAQAASWRINGTMRMGSDTGTGQPATGPVIVREAYSTSTAANHVLARTNNILLERDGTNGGIRWEKTATGSFSAHCTGITSTGSVIGYTGNTTTIGTYTIFTNAQNVVHFDCSFGYYYGGAEHTRISMSRYSGDYFWMGFITSTYNQ